MSNRLLLGLTAGLIPVAVLPQTTMARQSNNTISAISADFPFESRYVEVLGSVGEGRHFIQEDQPEMIGRTLANWRQRIGRD